MSCSGNWNPKQKMSAARGSPCLLPVSDKQTKVPSDRRRADRPEYAHTNQRASLGAHFKTPFHIRPRGIMLKAFLMSRLSNTPWLFAHKMICARRPAISLPPLMPHPSCSGHNSSPIALPQEIMTALPSTRYQLSPIPSGRQALSPFGSKTARPGVHQELSTLPRSILLKRTVRRLMAGASTYPLRMNKVCMKANVHGLYPAADPRFNFRNAWITISGSNVNVCASMASQSTPTMSRVSSTVA
mmetsp:Transcript_16796/g.12008  ORF Transcript_16796/g.12008 Transcript_16796/m.12008 type:complete len:243 (-) Transcript_16796:1044-1772(-)